LNAVPAPQEALRPDDAPLERLRQLVVAELHEVNRLVITRLDSRVGLIPELARHIIAAGGKRIRPLLTLAAARLCGAQGRREVRLAACVEFIHTATLLHDDVVDGSDLRRGRATANTLWGNKAPVLVGDFLFSRAFQLMVEDGDLRVLEILSHASAVIAEGEVAQLVTSNDTETDERAYLEVITGKTATLFAAACRLGAVVAGRPAADEEALARYGEALGIAFQLVDDALDYSAQQTLLGKTVGDDFRDGKITLPVILAMQRGDADDRAFLRRTLERGEQQEGDLERAMALFERTRALADTIRRAERFGAEARRNLARFPASPVRQALLDLVDFCIARAY
jgi:octaprenyl-diphosphate synthase